MTRDAIISGALALACGVVSFWFFRHARSTGDVFVAWWAGFLASWAGEEARRALRGGAR